VPGSVPLRIPRWIQLISLPLAALAIWSLAAWLQGTLLVLIVSSLVAILLNPLVERLVRVGLRRGVAVLAVYVSIFAVVLGAAAVLGAVVVQQVANAGTAIQSEFTAPPGQARTPADDRIDRLQTWLDGHGLSRLEIRPVGKKLVERIRKDGVTGYARRAIDVGETVATAVVTGIFRFVLVLVVSVYMLLDAPRLGRRANRLFPPGDDGRTLGPEVQGALAAYVRGQIIVSFIIGASAAIAMELYGLLGIWPEARTYAIFLGLFAMVMEVIPYVGPILGAVPAVVLATFTDPVTGLWVALAYLAIHQLEGHVVIPRVMGSAIRSHPLAVIFALLAGAELWGAAGALLALPLLSVLRATYDFVRSRVALEPWPLVGAGGVVGGGVDLAVAVVSRSADAPEASPSDAPSSVPNPPRVCPQHEPGTDRGNEGDLT
jgi:predicted PurR-regulated permease PerM